MAARTSIEYARIQAQLLGRSILYTGSVHTKGVRPDLIRVVYVSLWAVGGVGDELVVGRLADLRAAGSREPGAVGEELHRRFE